VLQQDDLLGCRGQYQNRFRLHGEATMLVILALPLRGSLLL
jgi:hypothetical protein